VNPSPSAWVGDPDAFPELERASARPIDGGVLIRWHVG
jgi:hypothetical protein